MAAAPAQTLYQALQTWTIHPTQHTEPTDNESVIAATRSLAAAAANLVTSATSPSHLSVREDHVDDLVDATLLFLDLTAQKDLHRVYPRPVATSVRYVIKILNAVHTGRSRGLGRASIKLSHALLAVIAFVELLDSASASSPPPSDSQTASDPRGG